MDLLSILEIATYWLRKRLLFLKENNLQENRDSGKKSGPPIKKNAHLAFIPLLSPRNS